MYDVSATWMTLIADQNRTFETKVAINGVEYGQSQIMSLAIERRMFSAEYPVVGACLSAEIRLSMLKPGAVIPRMASIIPYSRVTNGTTTSEWIPQGTFYIDTRDTTNNDDSLPILTLHGYDAMLKTEADYPSTSHAWPYADTDVVQEIATTIGVTVDARTWDVMVNNYQISLPAGYSMREVLGNIGAMYAGDWVMTYDGELLLVTISGIPPETNYLIDNASQAITFGGDRILV